MKKGFFMNLYVVRHGQTDWNIERRLQGTSNVPLNDTGIKQAQNLAETLKNIDIDFIFSSPTIQQVLLISIKAYPSI